MARSLAPYPAALPHPGHVSVPRSTAPATIARLATSPLTRSYPVATAMGCRLIVVRPATLRTRNVVRSVAATVERAARSSTPEPMVVTRRW